MIEKIPANNNHVHSNKTKRRKFRGFLLTLIERFHDKSPNSCAEKKSDDPRVLEYIFIKHHKQMVTFFLKDSFFRL